MSGGISNTFRSEQSAEDVMHGGKCHCGEHRMHQELHIMTDTTVETHRHNAPCSKKKRDMCIMVWLTPEHHKRAELIAKHTGQTVEQVVTDALTILWVRHATKNGW